MLVAVHDHKDVADDYYKKAGSPKQITPEMLLYTIFDKLFTQPNIIRLREGNTLFTLTPTEEGAMFMMFDADTPNNTIHNLIVTGEAAKKMGFKRLIGTSGNPTVTKLIKRAFDRLEHKNYSLKIKDNLIILDF